MATLTTSVRTLLCFYQQNPGLAAEVQKNSRKVPWDDIFKYVHGRPPRNGKEQDGRRDIRDSGWDTLYLTQRMLTAQRVVTRMWEKLAYDRTSLSYREHAVRRVSLAILYRFFTKHELCFGQLWRNLEQTNQTVVYSSELWNEIYRFRFGVSPEIDSTAEGRWQQLFEAEKMLSAYRKFLEHISFS